MVIHGLLSLLSSLVFRSLFNCFKMLICGFKYFCKLNFVMIRVWMYTKCLFIFRKMFFEKNVNFVIIRVWMYTKYCLFWKVLKKTTVYENFVCFDLSKQTRRSTLSCKVFILFPLKIYPFIGYKRKVRFCTQNSGILTLILKE